MNNDVLSFIDRNKEIIDNPDFDLVSFKENKFPYNQLRPTTLYFERLAICIYYIIAKNEPILIEMGFHLAGDDPGYLRFYYRKPDGQLELMFMINYGSIEEENFFKSLSGEPLKQTIAYKIIKSLNPYLDDLNPNLMVNLIKIKEGLKGFN